MPKWKVTGVFEPTGEKVTKLVEAISSDEAEAKMHSWGYFYPEAMYHGRGNVSTGASSFLKEQRFKAKRAMYTQKKKRVGTSVSKGARSYLKGALRKAARKGKRKSKVKVFKLVLGPKRAKLTRMRMRPRKRKRVRKSASWF